MRTVVVASVVAAAFLVAAAQAPEDKSMGRPEIPLGLDLYMPIPEDNPLTAEKVALGRRLFFDSILSRDYTLACSSCHDPRRVFADGLSVAVGVAGREGTRNAPALLNRVYGSAQFWDGRARSLEEQALQPIANTQEFDMTVEEVVVRLNEHHDYPARFQTAFGREVSGEDLARALASYVRTILSGDAPIDRYLNGEREALTEQARAGLKLFRGRGNCTACHLGPTFSDEGFHNTGIAWRDGEWLDVGRFAVTGKEEGRGAFKTPTLREVASTPPYMHDGSLAILEDVIEFYDRGGNPNPYLDPELKPLRLTTEEKQALVAFLRALSGTIREGMATSRAN
jgi:cytochrome c peroxidase